MAGKIPIGKPEAEAAIARYIEKNPGLTVSTSETGGFTLMPGDILIRLVDGGLKASAPNAEAANQIKMALLEIITEERANGAGTALSPAGGQRMALRKYVRDGAIGGSAIDAVKECQSTEKATYSTGGTRKAAAAKTNIAALMQAGGSLEIVKRIHEIDYIEVVGRATLGDQHAEGSRSFYKQEYLAKKAWEWIIKVLIKEPDIVSGTDEFGMPEFKEGAMIKTRIQDEDRNSFVVPLPAKIALWREMAREWQAAGRVCETVAYSRAADMLLRGDFQCKEELAEERAEVDGIRDSAKAEAA